MPNEFVVRHGFIVTGSSFISGTLSVDKNLFVSGNIIHGLSRVGTQGQDWVSSVALNQSTASTSYGFAHGIQNNVTEFGAHAEGYQTLASGEGAHSEGNATTASGRWSHTEGYSTSASGDFSHAEGMYASSVGYASHAQGIFTIALSSGSHAEGENTVAIGTGSHAEGRGTSASGSYSHAEGSNNQASGAYSHAEGFSVTSSGEYSHAEGYITYTSGRYAHAEGQATWASGQASHTEGYNTRATNTGAHAEGQDTVAEGTYSHAEGLGTSASADYQHAEGKYNATSSNALWILGDGTSNADRKNLITAFTNNVHVSGAFNVSGSVRMWQSASVSGTNIFGTASFADTASYMQTNYGRELHVSRNIGSDTTGDGSFLFPFRTIGKALHSASSGIQIVVHPGTYEESPTVSGSASNITITATNNEIGGIVLLSGSLTVNQNTSSTRVAGLTISDLIHTGSQNLYLQNCRVVSTVSKTGNGYMEFDKVGLDYPAAINITGPGSVVITNSIVGVVTVNNASAIVNLSNNISMITPTCTLGTLSIDGGVIYSLTNTTGAVFSGAGSAVVIANALCLTPSSTSARITLNAASGYSIQNVSYDRVNSTLGVSLNNRAQFQQVRGDGFTGSFSGEFSGSLSGSITSAETASYFQGYIDQGITLSVTTASTTWSLAHNLNTEFPIVTLWDSASKERIEPDTVKSIDLNNTQVTFTEPLLGYANIARAGAPLYQASPFYTASFALTASFVSGGVNVQNAISASYTQRSEFALGYSQSYTSQSTWVVQHNLGTQNVIVSTYDSQGYQFIPHTTQITDNNNIVIQMLSSVSGFAVVK